MKSLPDSDILTSGSEAFTKDLLDKLPGIVYVAEHEDPCAHLYVSSGIEMIGYSPEEWLANPLSWVNAVAEADRERVLSRRRDSKPGSEISCEYGVVSRSGRVLRVQERSRLSRNAEGGAFWRGVIIDISGLRLEEPLEVTEGYYRGLFEATIDAIVIFEPESELILEVNKAACDLYGFTRDEFIGISFKSITSDVARGEEEIRKLLDRGITDNYDTVHFRKDGVPVEMLCNGRLIDYKGKPAILVVSRDITQTRKLQQQLIQSEKLAALGQLVSGVAHELNNPLTSVLGYTELLLGSAELDSQSRERLEVVSREADRTRRIVHNLLSFARQRKPSRTGVDINDLLDRTLDLRAYDLRVNNISVIRKFGRLPRIMADEHQLQQVLLSIIVNAEQAMLSRENHGLLTVRTGVHVEDRGQSIAVSITDDGPGIQSRHLPRIFDPFFTTKPVNTGTGLGLSISYGIVKEHGGEIRVESRPGKGATFTIEIPGVIESGAS